MENRFVASSGSRSNLLTRFLFNLQTDLQRELSQKITRVY